MIKIWVSQILSREYTVLKNIRMNPPQKKYKYYISSRITIMETRKTRITTDDDQRLPI